MKAISRRGVTGIHQFTGKPWEQREGPYGMGTCVQERQWYPLPSFRVAKQSPVQCIWPEIPIFRKVWRRQGCHRTCRPEPWRPGTLMSTMWFLLSAWIAGQLHHTMSRLSPCRVLWLCRKIICWEFRHLISSREKSKGLDCVHLMGYCGPCQRLWCEGSFQRHEVGTGWSSIQKLRSLTLYTS